MKRYKLLKDLPTFNTGDIFQLEDDGCLYLVEGSGGGHWREHVMAYHRRTLERFPNILIDWFEELDDMTICGYDKELVEFAYHLRNEGITPHELKEHYHDFQWIAEKIQEDIQRSMFSALKGVNGE